MEKNCVSNQKRYNWSSLPDWLYIGNEISPYPFIQSPIDDYWRTVTIRAIGHLLRADAKMDMYSYIDTFVSTTTE